jgi:retron-type reverse transcriptase
MGIKWLRRLQGGLRANESGKFLKSGVMEDGLVSPVDEGTPQGGPLTPRTQKVTFIAHRQFAV